MKKRNPKIIKAFLEEKGLTKTPKGKEVDHKKPLVDGGSDSLSNLQLIKKSTHKKKTAKEARDRAKK